MPIIRQAYKRKSSGVVRAVLITSAVWLAVFAYALAWGFIG